MLLCAKPLDIAHKVNVRIAACHSRKRLVAMPTCPKCLKNKFDNPLEVWDQEGLERLCLLHSQAENKNKDGAFMALIEEKKANGDFNFSGAFFPDGIIFSKFTFVQKASFQDATFAKWVSFREAEFCEGVDFSYAKFVYPMKSNSSEIPMSCDFEFIKFNKESSFSNAHFKCPVFFNGSHFFCGAEFYGAKFEEYFSFDYVQLESWANFRSAKFLGRANFFTLDKCMGEIIFNQAKFFGNIIFTSFFINENNNKKSIKVDMTYTYIENEAFVQFKNSSVALIKFSGTNLRNIQFHNVDWYLYKGRQIIYDEYLLRNNKGRNQRQEDYAQVEELYRSIKLNYEEKGDLKNSGDFHYGEMEMHRMGSTWRRRFPFSWYNLYWALNGYGERPLRALIWFGVFLLTLTGTVYFLGLKVAGCNNSASLSEAFRFVIDKATLQRPDWAKPVTEPGHWLSAISVFIIPGQLALFFLALRNRLGRRR
jgi:uncharacterized protein YjbI with pentapeptide repeats